MKRHFFLITAFITSLTLAGQDKKNKERPLTPEEKLNKTYCTGIFQSTPGTILDVAGQPGAGSYRNILDWMAGRVPGLNVINTPSGRVPLIRGAVPAIFLDESQVTPSLLGSINTANIAIVKVIRTPFPAGYNGINGAIAIYSMGTENDEEDATPADSTSASHHH